MAKMAKIDISCLGIKADLETCLAQSRTGEIKAFPLGYRDISPQLQLPQKLYGRESQIDSLWLHLIVASAEEQPVEASNPTWKSVTKLSATRTN
jgi:hypothetical protein